MPSTAPSSAAPDGFSSSRLRLHPSAVARGRRRLHRRQASRGARLGGRPPAGPAALDADLALLARPGPGVLLDHHPPGAASRQLSHRRRPDRAIGRLLTPERPLHPVHLDQRPRHRHRQGHRPAARQDTDHVSCGALGTASGDRSARRRVNRVLVVRGPMLRSGAARRTWARRPRP